MIQIPDYLEKFDLNVEISNLKTLFLTKKGKAFVTIVVLLISFTIVFAVMFIEAVKNNTIETIDGTTTLLSYPPSYITTDTKLEKTPISFPLRQANLTDQVSNGNPELSKGIFDDSSLTFLDSCNGKYTNPNFESFTFTLDTCTWELAHNLNNEAGFANYFNITINLTNINFPNEMAELKIIAPGPVGWGGGNSVCSYEMDIVKIGNTRIFRDIQTDWETKKDSYIYSDRYVLPSYPNFIELFEYSDVYNQLLTYDLNYNIISYPVSYSTDGIQYCFWHGPDLISDAVLLDKHLKLIKPFYGDEDPSRKDFPLVIYFTTESQNMDFISKLDKIAETLTF